VSFSVILGKLNQANLVAYPLKLSDYLWRAVSAPVIDNNNFIGEPSTIEVVDDVDEGWWESALLIVCGNDDAQLDLLGCDRLLVYPGVDFFCISRAVRYHKRGKNNVLGAYTIATWVDTLAILLDLARMSFDASGSAKARRGCSK
jgi:hypothetical protein